MNLEEQLWKNKGIGRIVILTKTKETETNTTKPKKKKKQHNFGNFKCNST